jgi:hypothetical protein
VEICGESELGRNGSVDFRITVKRLLTSPMCQPVNRVMCARKRHEDKISKRERRVRATTISLGMGSTKRAQLFPCKSQSIKV